MARAACRATPKGDWSWSTKLHNFVETPGCLSKAGFASARKSYQLPWDGETPKAQVFVEENCKSLHFSADRGGVSGEG